MELGGRGKSRGFYVVVNVGVSDVILFLKICDLGLFEWACESALKEGVFPLGGGGILYWSGYVSTA